MVKDILCFLPQDNRVDLTALRVYTIDCEDPDEVHESLRNP